jgi:hypothetical protein
VETGRVGGGRRQEWGGGQAVMEEGASCRRERGQRGQGRLEKS